MTQPLFNVPPSVRTPVGSSTSQQATTSLTIPQPVIYAGPNSVGLIDSYGKSLLSGANWGTTTNETPSYSNITNSVAEQEGTGTAEQTAIQILSNGDHSLANGRIYWSAKKKELYLFHNNTDAMAANTHPRAQLSCRNRFLQQTVYHRFFIEFSAGCPRFPRFPSLTVNKNTINVWQMKVASDGPQTYINFVDPTNGLDGYRNLKLERNADPDGTGDSGAQWLVENVSVAPGFKHSIILDLLLDHRTVASGGRPYTALWYNGVQQDLAGDGLISTRTTAYATFNSSTGANTLPQVDLHIYRPGWSSQADEGCGLTFHVYRVEQSMTAPPLNTPYNAFYTPGSL